MKKLLFIVAVAVAGIALSPALAWAWGHDRWITDVTYQPSYPTYAAVKSGQINDCISIDRGFCRR